MVSHVLIFRIYIASLDDPNEKCSYIGHVWRKLESGGNDLSLKLMLVRLKAGI